jgi:serine/threonine protein kinase
MDKSFFEVIDKTGRMHWKDVKNLNVYSPEISRGDASFIYFAMRGLETMAIKSYSAQWMFDNEKILETEFNSMKQLGKNGFVPKLLEKPLRTRNNIYLVMELCNCGSMDMYLKAKKKVPVSIVKEIITFLAKFLLEMKNMKMLHRDLNPKHLLVNRDASENISYKIVGLLLCKDISKGEASSFVGTPDYMAPEAAQETPYANPADVWSVGITLYEIAIGCTPLKVDPSFRVCVKNGQLPKFPADCQIDLALKDLICRCLLFDPKKRITPEEILNHSFITGAKISNPLVGGEAKKREEKKELEPPLKKSVKELTKRELLKIIETDFTQYMEYVNATEDHKIKLKCESRSTLDPYVLKSNKPLSHGGFSEIFLCTHKVTGEEFALKIIKTSKMTDVKIAQLLLGEVEIMLELNLDLENLCPFAIRVEDYFVYKNTNKDPDGLPYKNDLCLIIEYCNGGDLDDYVRLLRRNKKEFPLEELKLISWNSACGLNEMHKRKMMHRDIKAKNILVVEDPKTKELIDIKLCDYGLSKKVSEHEKLNSSTILGTLDYFAPELYNMMERRMTGDSTEVSYNYKVDVWSYGVLLYFALYGKTIMEQPGSKHAVMKQKKIAYPIIPGVPESYINLVKRALNFDPAQRPTFSELLNDPFFSTVVIYPRLKMYPYTQGKLIGVGVTKKSEVYQCSIEESIYAMKIMKETEISRKSLIGEIDTLSKLKNSNNIIRLKEYFAINGEVYLIFHYYDGGDLEQYIKKRKSNPLSSDELTHIVYCVLNGIKDIHARNIIHRDISPNNILLSLNPDESVKNAVVGDFGCARILLESKNLTELFTGYKSPEMTLPEYNNVYDSKTDIWSFGMLLYYIIFEIHPNEHPQNHNMVKLLKTGDVKYDNARAQMYPQLVDLMNKCLKSNPKQRPTALELLMNPIFSTYIKKMT